AQGILRHPQAGNTSQQVIGGVVLNQRHAHDFGDGVGSAHDGQADQRPPQRGLQGQGRNRQAPDQHGKHNGGAGAGHLAAPAAGQGSQRGTDGRSGVEIAGGGGTHFQNGVAPLGHQGQGSGQNQGCQINQQQGAQQGVAGHKAKAITQGLEGVFLGLLARLRRQ